MDMEREDSESESPWRDVEISSDEKLMLSFNERENVENSDGVCKSLLFRSMRGPAGPASCTDSVDKKDVAGAGLPPAESPPLRLVDMKETS